jgi:hypothetical protein
LVALKYSQGAREAWYLHDACAVQVVSMRVLVPVLLFFLLADVTSLLAQESRIVVSVADEFGSPYPDVPIEVA